MHLPNQHVIVVNRELITGIRAKKMTFFITTTGSDVLALTLRDKNNVPGRWAAKTLTPVSTLITPGYIKNTHITNRWRANVVLICHIPVAIQLPGLSSPDHRGWCRGTCPLVVPLPGPTLAWRLETAGGQCTASSLPAGTGTQLDSRTSKQSNWKPRHPRFSVRVLTSEKHRISTIAVVILFQRARA